MKVLHLRDASADAAVVELHPQLTVVQGLDAARHAWLVESLAGLSSGSTETETEGELDVHGIRFPIDEATFTLLGLDAAKPAVVRAADLPGHIAEDDADVIERKRTGELILALTDELARQREALSEALAARIAATEEVAELGRGEGMYPGAVADAEAARSRRDAEAASAREGRQRLEDQLGRAVAGRDAATEAQQVAAGRQEAARDQHHERMAAASEAAAAVEEARSVAAENPVPTLEEARRLLEQAEAAVASADPEGEASPVSRRLTALEARRAELHGLNEALGSDGSAPLAAALDRLSHAAGERAPLVAALALADSWRDLHQQLRALDVGLAPEEVAAEQRVSGAKQMMMEAESDFNQPVLTPEQIARVEAAHAAVLEAQDRTEGRFGGARARKKLDEMRSEERRVLERLGFSTYADYMMSSSSRNIGPANQATLDTARHQLSAASAQLSTMPGAADRARRRTELLQRRDAVAPRVAELLDHEPTGPEAEDELRRLREPVAPEQEALAELAEELEHVGVVVGSGTHDRDDLVLLARSYVAERDATASRRSEVAEALQALDAAVDVLRQAHQRGATDLPELPELPAMAEPVAAAVSPNGDPQAQEVVREARWLELQGAQKAVTDLQSAVDRHRAASDRIATLEQELAACGEAVSSAAGAAINAEADLTVASGPALNEAVAAVAEVESSLARARAREEEIAAESDAIEADGGLEGLLRQAQRRLTDAERAVTEVAAAEQATAAQFAEADASHRAAQAGLEAKGLDVASADRAQLTNDFEWELVSRLAAVRSVGVVGAIPLVLDDPFAALADDEVGAVLERVAQMASAVQVVVVSDRLAVVEWAATVGPQRAAVA